MSTEAEPAKTSKVDDQLYSRQLYVLDHDAMARMSESSVLIIGMGGLGVEIAKNLTLMGVKEVALHCNQPATFHDLSANFYLTEADIGKPRAQACVSKVAQLNQYVKVSLHEAELTAETIAPFAAVVSTQASLSEEQRLDGICRATNTKFIAGGIYGPFAKVFVDCGDAHEARDRNGAPALGGMVSAIAHGKPAEVTLGEDERHGLEDGDFVTFTEVQGMEDLASHGPFPIKSTGPFSFEIPDTTMCAGPGTGGAFTEVKQPFTVSHRAMTETLKQPGELQLSDTGKIGRAELMIVAFQALDKFQSENSRLPTPASSVEAERVVQLAKTVSAERAAAGEHAVDITDENASVIRWLAFTAHGVLSPLASAIGGVMAQEAVKAISGKFHPLTQWLFHDTLEMLPATPLPEAEYAAAGNRYDGQVAVIGRALQEKILSQRYFLVGAGAIGCEILKTWAMMGVGCGPEGHVTVTDMDHIEKSNLSRQFLFRTADIGKPKSRTAAAAAQAMNPGMRVEALEECVGVDTEDTFDDVFFERLTGVCNALDNVEARLYVDGRCIFYKKPLLESGTLGTLGNTQIIVPHKTEHYGATRDPPEKSTPLCTLKNFPHKIEHTVQWARDHFEGEFVQIPQAVNAFISDPTAFLNSLREEPGTAITTLESVKTALTTGKPTTFPDCVAWARQKFADKFTNTIKQLLHTFPPGHRTSTGQEFWSGHKRVPTPLEFDPSDETHIAFISAAAHLVAKVYNIRPSDDVDEIRSLAAAVSLPEFKPSDGVKIVSDPDEEKREAERAKSRPAAGGTDSDMQAVLAEMPQASSLAGFQLSVDEFEKDDDSNFHMDYVAAVANLRARSYRIEETTVLNAKRIAGKIIPAIATTTALVSGLISVELYKLVQDLPVEAFRCVYASLAVPFVTANEPGAPQKSGEGDRAVTVWDGVDVHGPKTLGELIKDVESTKNVEVTVVSCGKAMLYSFFMPPAKQKERLATPVEKLAVAVSGKTLSEATKYIILEVCANEVDDDDKDVDLPTIRYRLP